MNSAPDPAFNDTDLDKAATEVVGYMGRDQGDSLVTHYGPPHDESEDHNSSWMSGFGPVA